MIQNILIVDDDAHICEVISFALGQAGFAHRIASNGVDALTMLAANNYDLMVLDVGMPELDGLDVCREVRKSSELPILFLSARDDEIDRILGLELGGDDYVTKPFSPRELVARIKSILKRTVASGTGDQTGATILKYAGLKMNSSSRETHFVSKLVSTTPKEFALLWHLVERPNIVFPREHLMIAAYGPTIYVSDRTIDSHIRNIRAKFAEAGCESIIETNHGIGFRLGSCLASSAKINARKASD